MLVLLRYTAIFGLVAALLFGQDYHPKGVHPRATPDGYAVKATCATAAYAASLVPSDQAKQLFAFDITNKYLVFEVAVFPTRPIELDADDFVIKRGEKGELSHQADASAVALAIQMENSPKKPSLRNNTQVVTEAHIGYERGRDPVTGQRVNGTYGGAGVGVQHGGPATPQDYPRPGGLAVDRDRLQTQLEDRKLPTGKIDHPVAGYLYFPRAVTKRDGNGNYVLEHLGETSATGATEKVELRIPAKSR
jgi:hypothetical protein